MAAAHQGVPTPGDNTTADEGSSLEPLRQGQPADISHESTSQAKKLTQYMATLFGKDRNCATFKIHNNLLVPVIFSTAYFIKVESKVLCVTDTLKRTKLCPPL